MQSKQIYSNLKPGYPRKSLAVEEPGKPENAATEVPEAIIPKREAAPSLIQNQHNQNYFEQSVYTASPAKLVEMLYGGALSFIEQAKNAIAEKDYITANTKIVRAEDIIVELNISLDLEKGQVIATNLRDLYNYLYKRLLEANSKKDTKILDEVYRFVKELKDIWSEVMKKEPRNPQESPVDRKILDLSR
ncbi:MAG TPA: flagellar export chaperone FliS [Thermotogota bacterium]|nr:flagellar export chaperone FliS [Thermotogota bacterium]HOZ11907.1 flagellar export chaperone FliS [Thermotogota bacterium]HPB86925.1 flagellar export chaperone FliS [Thermotogota bacterium]HPX97971.1 flagellar export chaperone FliS [Thermotogota bacterium]HQC38289.1 flagellar export chaperone FliS [Thermotogota bacterium]